jgi:hypothetical protein
MAGALGNWSLSDSGPHQVAPTAFIPKPTTNPKPLQIGYVPLKREAEILQTETELMSFRMGKGWEAYGSQVNETV